MSALAGRGFKSLRLHIFLESNIAETPLSLAFVGGYVTVESRLCYFEFIEQIKNPTKKRDFQADYSPVPNKYSIQFCNHIDVRRD